MVASASQSSTGTRIPVVVLDSDDRASDLVPGNGSPGAWPARAAGATMRGWLVMTDSWAQFYRVLLMVLLDGTRPSEALEWVSPVAPAVTQAAVGAGHWAAGRRRRALAAWASAAGFGLVAWGLGTEAPTRAEAKSTSSSKKTCCASVA